MSAIILPSADKIKEFGALVWSLLSCNLSFTDLQLLPARVIPLPVI